MKLKLLTMNGDYQSKDDAEMDFDKFLVHQLNDFPTEEFVIFGQRIITESKLDS